MSQESVREELRKKEKEIGRNKNSKKSSRQPLKPFVVPEGWEPPEGTLAREIWEFKKQNPHLLVDMSQENVREELRKKGKDYMVLCRLGKQFNRYNAERQSV